jgi:hypothetical protein
VEGYSGSEWRSGSQPIPSYIVTVTDKAWGKKETLRTT